MADIEVKDLTLMTADITALDVIPITDVSTGETLKTTTQTLLNAISLLPIKGRDGGDIGGYLMDGVDDYIIVPANNNLNFGTGDFAIEIYFILKSTPPSVGWLLAKGTGSTSRPGYAMYVNSSNVLVVVMQDTTTTTDLNTSIQTLVVGTVYHVVAVFDRDANLTVYVNGVSVQTADISARNTAVGDGIFDFNIGSYIGSSFLPTTVYLVRLYNRILTATEIASIYNNGRPDLYSLVYSERNANNTSLTSGTLTIGKRYRLKDFITGDDFTNVGAASNADGVEFVATGTTPTTWINSSEVIPIGCVAEYLPRNAGSLGWIESSGNQLSGSTSGSPVCLTKESRPPHYRDIRKSIAANTNTTLTSIVPRGYKIVSIRAKGSDSLADIKIGSASAGEQIVAATTTSSTTPKLLILAATANDAYSESADVTLYARHDTSASGKTMDLIFHFEKVGN